MILHFVFGFLGSLLGGVVFGPINLSVVDLTLKKGIRSALRFSASAALVEIFLATIAILFGKLISRKIEEFPEFKLIVIAFFLILGVYFILKKDIPKSEIKADSKTSNFFNGFIVAFLNPQTIPYWIFVLAYLKSANVLYLHTWNLFLFLIGLFFGKFIMLGLYGYMSKNINKHFNNLNDYVSKAIGGFLIIVGLIQAINYFFF